MFETKNVLWSGEMKILLFLTMKNNEAIVSYFSCLDCIRYLAAIKKNKWKVLRSQVDFFSGTKIKVFQKKKDGSSYSKL